MAVLVAAAGVALVLGGRSAAALPVSQFHGWHPKGLVLWNTLGSSYAVRHSVIGPNLDYYDCYDPTTPSFGGRCSIDVMGQLAFVPGVAGSAATIGDGPYFPEARVHTLLLRHSVFNPEHGAVEVLYRQQKDPQPYVDNPHRIFGGPYALTGPDDVALFAQDRVDSGDPRLHFVVSFGGNPTHPIYVRSIEDGGIGYPITGLNGQWMHIAGVWDRKGIAGSSDTIRLYVNGKVVATSRSKKWGTTPCGKRFWGRHRGACFTDVVGCNDTCAGTFAVEDLELWSYARTEW